MARVSFSERLDQIQDETFRGAGIAARAAGNGLKIASQQGSRLAAGLWERAREVAANRLDGGARK